MSVLTSLLIFALGVAFGIAAAIAYDTGLNDDE